MIPGTDWSDKTSGHSACLPTEGITMRTTDFTALMTLQHGWYNGTGRAPDKKRLPVVWERLFSVYPDGLLKPMVIPTQDGGLHFCWEDGKLCPTIDYDLETDRAYFHAWSLEKGKDGIEHEFVVKDAEIAREMWLLAKRTLDETRLATIHIEYQESNP